MTLIQATKMNVKTKKQQKWKLLLERLEMRCLQPISEFKKLGSVVDTKDGPLIHIDKGSKILGVAHLDTVAKKTPSRVEWFNCGKRNMPIIQTIQLDDRLGVWVLLDLLPAMGLEFDVLLCDGEESGRSTAAHFNPEKEYNWGFEFDRAGMDTVLYDYEDDESWSDSLKDFGFDIRFGSFSDISKLTHLGCCFANFGVGYHYQHTHDCYARLDDTIAMALEFESWFKEMKEEKFPYVHTERAWTYGTSSIFRRFGDVPHYPKKDMWNFKDNRVDNRIRCPVCQASDWADDGICLICGYDPVVNDQYTLDDEEECPYCGRYQFIDEEDGIRCDYCGFVGSIR